MVAMMRDALIGTKLIPANEKNKIKFVIRKSLKETHLTYIHIYVIRNALSVEYNTYVCT
jgi:diketogulonate reductase-like aldo/keto reductase